MHMSGYTKLFNSILASTIWREPNHVRIVWITLLAMANKHGVAEGSVPGLADFARVSIEECRDALRRLMDPDRDSRSEEFDGRRIESVDGGWLILNHDKYRAKLDEDERRAYLRRKKAESRARSSQQIVPMSTDVNVGQSASTLSTQAEAEADTEAKTKRKEHRTEILRARPVAARPEPKGVNPGDFPPEVLARVADFIERYKALYVKYRHGAHYLSHPQRDFPEAALLCQTWDDARLDKLAMVFLQTDHEFAEQGSRTLAQFRSLASWCDGRLAEVEAKAKAGTR